MDDEETESEDEAEGRAEKRDKGGGKTKKKKTKKKKGRSIMCNRACRFAFPNEPAVYCAMHALEGMVDVLNPQCSVSACARGGKWCGTPHVPALAKLSHKLR